MAPWWWFSCKPKHVGAVLLILKCFNNSAFFNVVCISWKLKCWILLMHGVTMKFNHMSFLFMSSLLYCGIQGECGTKNTTPTAFNKSLMTFSVSDRFVCGLLPTMGKVLNTINITRRANQCHPTPTAVKMSSLFADCASC